MRLVSVAMIKENAKLARTVYNNEGTALLPYGTLLEARYIRRLDELGITEVYIDDEISKGIEIDETISVETRQDAKKAIKETFEKFSFQGTGNYDGIYKSSSSIINDLLNQKEVMVNISDIRASGNTIFSHSVNVCSLSVILAMNLGYNMQKVKDVAVGALMHDIGRTLLKKKIEKERLENVDSKIDIEKQHPKEGYDHLCKDITFSPISKIIILMHHENLDGSGFPLKLKNNDIHEAARIVSICNTFDKMVSGSEGTEKYPVYQVIEYLSGITHVFDPLLVKKFSEKIAIYPSGSGVKLSGGERGIVVRQNKSMPTRPVVRILEDENKTPVTEIFEIDLLKEFTIFITECYEI